MNNNKFDINRLHKQKSNLNDMDLINRDLELKRKNRESAKQRIIEKASSEYDDGKPDHSVTQSIKPLSNVKVIKNKLDSDIQIQKVKDTQERLSYTLQMEPITSDQVNNYRRKYPRNEKAYLDNKFSHLNTRVMRIYLVTIIVLLFLIAIALIILFNLKGE